jgi:ankyrin repeat protein
MGHADIVTALLAAGALADTRDNLGWTAYDAAMYNNQVASAQLVMQHRRARGET